MIFSRLLLGVCVSPSGREELHQLLPPGLPVLNLTNGVLCVIGVCSFVLYCYAGIDGIFLNHMYFFLHVCMGIYFVFVYVYGLLHMLGACVEVRV